MKILDTTMVVRVLVDDSVTDDQLEAIQGALHSGSESVISADTKLNYMEAIKEHVEVESKPLSQLIKGADMWSPDKKSGYHIHHA
ncbi:hypothetical protein [Vibrio sp. R78045]|uniref:hypothetical protein n=1 Tax=Vibrio sp. R78045 TaxID=3093868 RepID=UPI0036F3425D